MPWRGAGRGLWIAGGSEGTGLKPKKSGRPSPRGPLNHEVPLRGAGAAAASGGRFRGQGESQSTESILGSETILCDSVMAAAKSLLEQSNGKKCEGFPRLCQDLLCTVAARHPGAGAATANRPADQNTKRQGRASDQRAADRPTPRSPAGRLVLRMRL